MKSKICKSCEEEFDPRCSTQVYCTDECRVKGIRYQPVEKICAREECSSAFSVPKTHQKKIYCSRSCAATVNNSRFPKKERTVKQERCANCDKEMAPGVGGNIYCDHKCQWDLQRKNKLENWLLTGEASVHGRQTHYVRDHIFREQAGLCSVCSMPDEWNGTRLVFILDHIDGNAENNRRDNLRLVCPNCDSQLPTYKAKNRGNGRHSRRERYAAGKSY